jgi:flavodoxin
MDKKELKTLVVYYTLEENCQFVANSIGFAIGADTERIKTKKNINPKNFMKYIVGGKQVIFKEKPEILPIDKELNNYDLLFIGTPTWAGNFTPALRTFLDKYKIKDKHIALYCCCVGNEGKTLVNLKKELEEDNKIVDELVLKEPIKKNKEDIMVTVKNWATEVLKRVQY